MYGEVGHFECAVRYFSARDSKGLSVYLFNA